MTVIDATTAAQTSQESSVVLVDVRSPSDWLNGVPIHAQLWSSTELLDQAEQLTKQGKKVYVICYQGQTSKQLVDQLSQQWGGQFLSIEGGFRNWLSLGLATEIPQLDLPVCRYERQVKLAGFGEKSQQKLQDSHVLVVGAGGLGAPLLLYLAGAGLGRMTIIDDDIIALHNLHRQILYQQTDVGQPKAVVAKQRLEALNDSIKIHALDQRLTGENVDELLEGVDIIVDGCDNISTRYVINDACLKHGIPWLFAAVSEFDIQLALFSGDKKQPCYRCLFPHINDVEMNNCGEIGVLGTVPGLAGMLQATEVIKYLTGLGDCLAQKMLTYDLLHHQFKVLKYPSNFNNNCHH